MKRRLRRFGIAIGVALGAGPMAAQAQAAERGLSLSLLEAVRLAVGDAPTVASAQARWRSAQARVDQARSDRLPQLSMSAGYTRFQEPNIVVPIHTVGVFPPLDEDVFEGLAQVSLPLLDGGRRRAAQRAAAASADKARAQRDRSEQQLIEGVTSLFVRYQVLEDTEQLVAARLRALRQRQHEFSLLAREGRVSPGDVALVDAAIASAAADSLDVAAQAADLATRLGVLVGSHAAVRPVTSQLRLQALDDWAPPASETPAAIRPEAPRRETAGPEVRAAQAQLAREQALQAQAAGSFWPDVIGFGTYSLRSGGDLDAIGEWGAGVRLQLPLFDAGRRSSGVRAARAAVEAAAARTRLAILNQDAELQMALDQWHMSRARRQQLQAAAVARAVAVAAQQALFSEGRLSLGELLTQESELLQLQAQERAAACAILLAGLRYHAAAGSLTVEWIHHLPGNSP